MKIIIINGSPRKNGSTAFILHEIERNLMNQGAEVVFYDLCDENIALCNGCCACYKIGHCIIDDDADKISKKLQEADGVVIGSSTIASNVSGVMKVFIDRGHFVIEQLLHNKYALCITTYENYGGREALKVLKSLATLSGAMLSGTIIKKLTFNSECSNDKDIKDKAKKYAIKLYKDIENGKLYGLQKIKQKIVRSVGLKSFVLRKGQNYEGVIKRWSDIGLL